MHLDNGWDGIGYHKVILRSGIIENGRPEFWIGAHVKGLNKSSLGVCLIGSKIFTDIHTDKTYKWSGKIQIKNNSSFILTNK